jgi:hypothetical protein
MDDQFFALQKLLPALPPEETEGLLDRARGFVLDYCNLDEFAPKLNSLVLEVALIMYNRRGAEGSQSVSDGGVSESFLDLPVSVSSRLNRYRRPGYVRR